MPRDSPEDRFVSERPASLETLRRRAVIVCIATTLTIAVIELVIGVLFRLISITAEGLHTTADLIDSLIAFALVAIAARPADRDHPYGHGKFDSLAAIIEGSFVAASGLWAIGKSALVLLGQSPADPRPENVTIVAMLAAAVVYAVVSTYVIRLSRRTRSPAVFAEAMHLRTHVWITVGLMAGLGLSRYGLREGWSFANRIDALTAIILGTYLLTVGYRIIAPGFGQLMDLALPEDEHRQLQACLEQFRDEFVEVHAIRTRRAGTERHVDIHLVVAADMTVDAAHQLSHRIEERLVAALPGTRLLAHIEPAVGEALADYEARQRVGVVIAPQTDPFEREKTHHANERAHQH